MASNNELKLIKLCVRFGARSCLSPTNWDSNTQLLDLQNFTTRKKSLYYLYLIILYLYFGFNCWRIWEIFIMSPPHSQTAFNFVLNLTYLFIVIASGLGMLIEYGFAITHEELLCLFNQLLIFCRREFAVKNRSSKQEKYFVWTIGFQFVTSIQLCLAFTLIELYYFYLQFPNQIFIYSPFIPTVACIVFTCSSLKVGLIILYMYFYYTAIKTTLSSCNQVELNGITFEVQQDKIDAIVINYKCLLTPANYFNSTYCVLVVPIVKYSFCLAIMISIFMAVSLKNDGTLVSATLRFISGVAAACAYILIAVFAQLTSNIWEDSSKFLWEFQHIKKSQIVGKKGQNYVNAVGHGFQPIRFAVGKFYYMERDAKLTLTNFIVCETVNLLVEFN